MKQTVNRKWERGQSLVEVALFFPIFIILIAGLVEVSQLVITKNRISNAARTGARFGANGGEDEAIVTTALNSVTQTLGMEEDMWDIWIIRATINDAGDGFAEWSFSHAYGISGTVTAANVDETAIQDQVLGEINIGNYGSGGLRLVGAYMIHDVNSILGLDALPGLASINSINGLSVMREIGATNEVTNGCDAFPIAVHDINRSISGDVGVGSNPYVTASEFDYPASPPRYQSFTNHIPDVPFPQAKEGSIFYIKATSDPQDPGNFGWLTWNTGIQSSANTLADSLTWPGDSKDYTPLSGQGVPGSGLPKVRGYINAADATDTSMQVGDWVASSTGSISSNNVRAVLEGHIQQERDLRVILYDTTSGAGGQNSTYHITGFAIFKLHGYHLSQGQGGSWILAEFIRLDNSCGQN